MEQILNTLFVQLQSTYLHLDHDTVKVECEGETRLRVPLHHLGALALFGNVLVSPFLIHRCAEDGRSIVWFSQSGKFRARMVGPTSGNILLRQAQYRAGLDPVLTVAIARRIVGGKVQNTRNAVMRAAREAEGDDRAELAKAARELGATLRQLKTATDVNVIRGFEGRAGHIYFGIFHRLVKSNRDAFLFHGRNRRPPQDPLNCLLSFAYALLRTDCIAACEGVGLDPQLGYLHSVRPGRPSLALDLMEELRPIIADRVVLSLVNLQQVKPDDFDIRTGGAVEMRDGTRKLLIEAYQRRKQEKIQHPVVEQRISIGLVPHVQARLLARYLREDANEYQPFVPK